MFVCVCVCACMHACVCVFDYMSFLYFCKGGKVLGLFVIHHEHWITIIITVVVLRLFPLKANRIISIHTSTSGIN